MLKFIGIYCIEYTTCVKYSQPINVLYSYNIEDLTSL